MFRSFSSLFSATLSTLAITAIVPFSILVFMACSSPPVIPELKDIKVSREAPKASCKSLGFIEGKTSKINGTPAEAIEDMKSDAIKKGANYIKMETMGAHGGSVRGEAFFCD